MARLSVESWEYSLTVAAMEGEAGKVKELIGKGADVNTKDGKGNTVLIEAAREGHLDVVKMLVESAHR